MNEPIDPGTGDPINSFKIPLRGTSGTLRGADDHPLVPWHMGDHSLLYAPIDNTEALFHEFVTRIGDADSLADNIDDGNSNPIVIVGGLRRSGKSSLMNRCADHLARVLTGLPARDESASSASWKREIQPERIDFIAIGGIESAKITASMLTTYSKGAELNIDKLIYKAILKEIQKKGWYKELSEEERSPLLPNGSEASDAPDIFHECYENLGALLIEKGRYMIVLIPRAEDRNTQAFGKILHTCLNHGKGGIFFFAEAIYRDISRAIAENHDSSIRNRIIALQITNLNSGDFLKFTLRRTSPGLWSTPYTKLTEDALEKHGILKHSTVGDLQKSLVNMAKKASESSGGLITYDQLQSYHEEIKLQREAESNRTDREDLGRQAP